MSKFPNHYETLNVSKDASFEEIRASYHTLCKLFHPDLNPHMQDGLLMIEELTNSYEVLKDKNAREDYDMKYLIQMSKKVAPAPRAEVNTPPALPVEQLPVVPELKKEANQHEFLEFKLRQAASVKKEASPLKVAAMAALAMIGVLAITVAAPKLTSKIGFIDIGKMISSSEYVRPVAAPNGSAFPETSSYISGYELGRNTGSTSLLVSNAKNDNDVYLKVVALDENKASTVRHVFVKAKSDFTVENLSAGKYEVQYMDLTAGLAGKSETFSVVESKDLMALKTTNFKVTLQTAVNGVLKVQNISIDEFNSLASL